MTRRFSWLYVILLSLLVLLLTSCGEDGLFAPPTPTVELALATSTAIPLPADASTAARIRAQGHLRVGVRYDDAPFGFVDDQGDLIGFDVDLARAFAQRWLGDAEAVRYVQVTDGSVGERIRTGQVDLVIGALTRHRSLARDMNFSTAYYYDGLSLMVRTARAITDTLVINGPGDLDEVAVGVVEETDTEAPLLRVASASVPQVVYYPDYFSAVTGLENGVVAAVVGPRRTLERLANGSAGLGLTPRFTRDSYAIGVPKSDGPLLDLVNVTLMNLISDGVYQRLFDRWLPNETPPALEVWTGTSRIDFAGLSARLDPMPNTIGDIETRGFLVVGLSYDQLPFGDFDASAVARGFEAELSRVLAGRWLGDVTAVQFVRHTEESGIAALQTGQIDLLAAHIPHTLPRDDEIDFSQTIYLGGIGLLVSAGSGIEDLTGLNGSVVAVSDGGTTADVVQRALNEVGIAVSVQTVNDANAALAGVADGRYRAFAAWRIELLNLAYTNSGFLVLDERLTQRPIALGLRQYDPAFRDLVDLTLQALATEGRFAALYDDWFGTDPPYPVEIWLGTPYRPLRLKTSPGAVPTAVP